MMLDHRMNDVVLNAQSEWRFHVPAKAVCTITLVHGLAEVFGAEVCAAVFRFASGVLAYDLHSCSCLDALRALVLLLPPVPVLPVLLVAPLWFVGWLWTDRVALSAVLARTSCR